VVNQPVFLPTEVLAIHPVVPAEWFSQAGRYWISRQVLDKVQRFLLDVLWK
jgi:hypothetical protein